MLLPLLCPNLQILVRTNFDLRNKLWGTFNEITYLCHSSIWLHHLLQFLLQSWHLILFTFYPLPSSIFPSLPNPVFVLPRPFYAVVALRIFCLQRQSILWSPAAEGIRGGQTREHGITPIRKLELRIQASPTLHPTPSNFL